MGRNGLKFYRVDAAMRAAKRDEWNRPLWWPLGALIAALVLGTLPAIRSFRRRERTTALGGAGR